MKDFWGGVKTGWRVQGGFSTPGISHGICHGRHGGRWGEGEPIDGTVHNVTEQGLISTITTSRGHGFVGLKS